MGAKTYYYARVSSKDQNLARQIEAFMKDGADERDIITEKASGKDMDRPEYQAMKAHMLRDGDTLVVKSLDRLGRNKNAIKNELQYYKDHDIRIRVLDLPTTNIQVQPGQEWIIEMVNNILIEVLSSMAEQEHETIHRRQAEGIAIARAEGKYHGRQYKHLDTEQFADLYVQCMDHKISKAEMARRLNISRPTLDRRIKRYIETGTP